MYRLYNLSIGEKVDWLVKHKDLLRQNIVISPWNEFGMSVIRFSDACCAALRKETA